MMPITHIVMWTVFIVTWMACVTWHCRENRRLRSQLAMSGIDHPAVERLMHFAWSRSFQYLLLMLCSISVLFAYDWQIARLRAQADALQIAARAANPPPPLPPKELAVPAAPAIATPPASLAAPATAAALQSASAAIPAAPATPAPVPPPQAQGTPAQPPVNWHSLDDIDALLRKLDDRNPANIMGELFEPEKSSSEVQSQLDDIKRRYESIFVTYFFLKKCGHARTEDYHIINSSLVQNLASLNAPSRIQYDILTAAKGSYDEIYARSSCDQPSVAQLERQYSTYMQTLLDNYSVPQIPEPGSGKTRR